MGQDEGEEGEVPEEVLSSHHLVEGDEHEGLTEHGEDDVVDPVELGGDHEEEDELGEEGHEVEAEVVILHSEVEQVEVDAEVVPDVLPGDVVEVRLLQEVLAVESVAEPCEEAESDEAAEDEPHSGHVDLQQGLEAVGVGEGKVEGEAVDDGVDLHVDRQAVHDAGQYEDLLLVEVDGQQHQSHDD